MPEANNNGWKKWVIMTLTAIVLGTGGTMSTLAWKQMDKTEQRVEKEASDRKIADDKLMLKIDEKVMPKLDHMDKTLSAIAGRIGVAENTDTFYADHIAQLTDRVYELEEINHRQDLEIARLKALVNGDNEP